MSKHKIEIECKFGSEFQNEFGSKSVLNVLRAWKNFLNSSHKKNNVKVKIDDIDIDHLDWLDLR
jgi:hypothetical protein